MASQKEQRYKMVQVSKETFDLLFKLQNEAQVIFGKRKISFDRLIRWLIVSKIDWVEMLLEERV